MNILLHAQCLRHVSLLGLGLLIAGCQVAPENYQAAYIEQLDDKQMQEVAGVIQQDLGLSSAPLLSNDAFQDSPILVLAPALANTPQGKLASGRSIEPPPRFQLITNQEVCLLENVATGVKHPLSFDCFTAKPTTLSREVWIDSRQTSIPITLVQPAESKQPLPLVILIHGHGGTRHEAGGFTQVAEVLAEQGIASVRMDFPGCGDSRESFSQNNLTNMLEDIEAAHRYAQSELDIDPTRIGLLGFSMGGRLALLYSQTTPVKTMALWAPAATDGASSMITALGGQSSYAQMKARAAKDGAVPFTTAWGQQQLLGRQFFTDIENSRPSSAINEFEGDLFVLYGSLDQVVKPAVPQAVYNQAARASSRQIYVVKGADHGLGLFSSEPELTAQAVNETTSFFTQHL